MKGSQLRLAFAALMALHGLIHLLGPAKAFGWGSVSQLQAPISTEGGLLWLLAALLLLASAVGIALQVPWWWLLALPAVLLS